MSVASDEPFSAKFGRIWREVPMFEFVMTVDAFCLRAKIVAVFVLF